MLVDGAWVDVARIDTADGEVHRHQFTADGGNYRTVYEVVPAGHGEDVIDRWFDRALDMMNNEWQENIRRWHRDKT
jgi:hypothetical protein